MSTSGRRTHYLAAVPAGRPRIAGLVHATARRLSDRVHAAADDRARALGWESTEIPGWLGLSGRSYRDPWFDARRRAAITIVEPGPERGEHPGAGSGAGSAGRQASIPRQYMARVIGRLGDMPRQATQQAEPEAGS